MKENKFYIISPQKEKVDTETLVDIIKGDDFMDQTTVIVNCFPEHTSRIAQVLNHKLCYLNGDELFAQKKLMMPYLNMTQIIDDDEDELTAQLYDSYLANWVSKLHSQFKYLFVINAIVSDRPLNKLKLMLNVKGINNVKYATIYKEKNSSFKPDYFVSTYDQETVGKLLFWYENSKNK